MTQPWAGAVNGSHGRLGLAAATVRSSQDCEHNSEWARVTCCYFFGGRPHRQSSSQAMAGVDETCTCRFQPACLAFGYISGSFSSENRAPGGELEWVWMEAAREHQREGSSRRAVFLPSLIRAGRRLWPKEHNVRRASCAKIAEGFRAVNIELGRVRLEMKSRGARKLTSLASPGALSRKTIAVERRILDWPETWITGGSGGQDQTRNLRPSFPATPQVCCINQPASPAASPTDRQTWHSGKQSAAEKVHTTGGA